MRRIVTTLLITAALGACGDPGTAEAGTAAPSDVAAAPTAAPEAPTGRIGTGLRAIDKARGAADLASNRALQHDTIR